MKERLSPGPVSNRLLAALPRQDRLRVTAGCEQVDLKFADVLCEPRERIKHVYFPVDCFISLAAPADGRATLEVGLIGNEGMVGIPAILGIEISAQRALVRGSGTALRMQTAQFHRNVADSAALHRALNRYLYALMAQFAQTAVCTRFHVLDARLARWLLMTQDRAHSDRFHFTQDFLADMLGVRRVGVQGGGYDAAQEADHLQTRPHHDTEPQWIAGSLVRLLRSLETGVRPNPALNETVWAAGTEVTVSSSGAPRSTPIEYGLLINMKTAKVLGITIP